MFERFTDRARRVIVLAQEEARLLGHNYIGTEHILLGIVHEGEGVGATAMKKLNIGLEAARAKVEELVDHSDRDVPGHIPFTPRSRKVCELALREALQLGHNYIGTEHILLGLIREGEGVGAQVLVMLGADLSVTRQTIIGILSGYEPRLREPVKLEFSPGAVDSLVNWISHFDRANGPLAEDHPLRMLYGVLTAAPPTVNADDLAAEESA